MSAVNVTLLPYSGLLAGEEIMLMGTTIPAPVDSAITNVTLVSSTSLASRQPVTAGLAVSPLTVQYFTSYMTSSTGFWNDTWPTPYPSGCNTTQTNSSGTTFYSCYANSNDGYWSGQVWQTTNLVPLSNPDDGFEANVQTNKNYISGSARYMEMATFAADGISSAGKCAPNSSDDEYGIIYNQQNDNSHVLLYYQGKNPNGGSYSPTYFAEPMPKALTTLQTVAGEFDSSTPYPYLYMWLGGTQYNMGINLWLSSKSCFTIGWNSQNQSGNPKANPYWYLFSNYVFLMYG